MLRTALVTIVLAIVFFVAERYMQVAWLHPSWKAMLVFFISVSFLLHRLVDLGLQGDREQFVPMYLGATVARQDQSRYRCPQIHRYELFPITL